MLVSTCDVVRSRMTGYLSPAFLEIKTAGSIQKDCSRYNGIDEDESEVSGQKCSAEETLV